MARRDYKRKNLKNPFFKQKKTKKNKKIFFLSLIFLLVFAFIIYLLFYSNLFLLKNIEVLGAERSNIEEIKALIWQKTDHYGFLDIRKDNLLLISKNNLKKEIKNNFNLAEVRLNKVIFNKLKIEIIERQPAFLLKTDDGLEHRDNQACLIDNIAVTKEDVNNKPILRKKGQVNSCLSLAEDYLNDIFEIYNLSFDYNLFPIKEFILNGDRYTITLKLESGPSIYFNRRDDKYIQFEKLKGVFFDLKEDVIVNIEYIDVRYGNKAFIKYNN